MKIILRISSAGEDGLVRPNADITRAEVAAIFFRLLKDDVRDSNLTAENALTMLRLDCGIINPFPQWRMSVF